MWVPAASRTSPNSATFCSPLQAPLRQRAAVLAPATARKQAGGKGFGKGAGSKSPSPAEPTLLESAVPATAPSSPSSRPAEQPPAAVDVASGGGTPALLPAVGRGRILAICAQVSVLVTTLGFGLRQVAPAISPAVKDGYGDSVEALLNWATLPGASQLALAVAVAAGVTAARTALLTAWPEFREASERSNQQVLSPLSLPDLLLVGGLPAVSEELLFRGALIPAIYPDWRGVVIAGVAFGVLHNNGGRNPAFAAWASVVGCAYGALFLATGSVACPALAHTLANVASGALWKAAHPQGGSGGGSSGGSKSGGGGSGA